MKEGSQRMCQNCKNWKKLHKNAVMQFDKSTNEAKRVGVCKVQLTPMTCLLTTEDGFCDDWEEQ